VKDEQTYPSPFATDWMTRLPKWMKEGNPNIDDRIFKTKKVAVRDFTVVKRMIRTS
jgi:hypothetical protein